MNLKAQPNRRLDSVQENTRKEGKKEDNKLGQSISITLANWDRAGIGHKLEHEEWIVCRCAG